MKIIAQSIVAPRLPYIHVAYLAATTFVPKISLMFGGIILFIAGSKLCFKFFRNKSNTFSLLYLKKCASNKQFMIGLLALVLSCIFIILAVKFGKQIPQHPDAMTMITLRHSVISYHHKNLLNIDKNDSISSLDKFFRSDQIKNLQDGWFHPVALKTLSDAEETKYFLVSAGKDEEFDTYDDVVYQYSLTDERLLEANQLSQAEFLEIEKTEH